MFYSDNVNDTSSTIKGNNTTSGTLDYWYYTNIDQTGYGDYIEDTVYCNDRSIYNLNGWNPDGGRTTSYLYFGAYGRLSANKTPSLECPRDKDKFTQSTSNGNGALDYPVGLLTADEVALAGGKSGSSNSSYYLNTGQVYWLLSPYSFYDYYANGFCVNSGGRPSSTSVYNTYGARPVVSLRPGITISDGEGSTSDPYVIESVVSD